MTELTKETAVLVAEAYLTPIAIGIGLKSSKLAAESLGT